MEIFVSLRVPKAIKHLLLGTKDSQHKVRLHASMGCASPPPFDLGLLQRAENWDLVLGIEHLQRNVRQNIGCVSPSPSLPYMGQASPEVLVAIIPMQAWGVQAFLAEVKEKVVLGFEAPDRLIAVQGSQASIQKQKLSAGCS